MRSKNEKNELNLVLRLDTMNVKWEDKRLTQSELKKTVVAPRIHYKHQHNSQYTSRMAAGIGYRAPLSLFESQHGTNEEGFEINITNPKGFIIMGRENDLSIEQKKDFEVVKRKYKNVIDIISYDDLLNRLKFTIEQIKKN